MGYSLGPMLAGKFEEARVQKLLDKGPLWAQPKIDGFRIICWEGKAMSRSWKLWTNRYLQQWAEVNRFLTHGMDGEFFVGHQYKPDGFRETMSGGRAEDGASNLGFYWFDFMRESHQGYVYKDRFNDIVGRVADLNGLTATSATPNGFSTKHYLISNHMVSTIEEIYQLEEAFLAQGWEGLILRTPSDPYKFGRGTPSAGPLIKLKRFEDGEATITAVEPRYRNDNELQASELGYAKRTSHQENLVAEEIVGAFYVSLHTGVGFKIGVFNGVGMETKAQWWRNKDRLIGQVVEFKHQGYGGGYDAPRTPVFQRFRNPIELT